MRIVRLTAENVKRLRAVEITPEGDVVVVSGRNGQGKTSVLDAIWMALAGAAGAKETTRPIRDGETHAEVTVDLGDLIVSRKWTDAGTTLHVASPDGARYSSPQTMLDGLIGRLTFDPLAFAEQPQREQLATLLSVVELPFDPAHLARQRQAVFEQRTDANREAKRIEAAISQIPAVLDGTPDEHVDPATIAAELEAALAQNSERDDIFDAYERAKATAARLATELAKAEDDLRGMEAQIVPDEVDVAAIRARLAEVNKLNTSVRAKQERATLAAQLEAHRAQSADLSAQLEAIDKTKADGVAAARMPLQGLSFDEEGVLYDGIPFAQASSAERLRVSVAIAMALNPEIRVIRISDGSLLDSENLAVLGEMAAEHDFQVWVERVDETGAVGVVIEDGAVVVREAEVAA